MTYITELIKSKTDAKPGCISLEEYIIENSYITRYLSRIVKDKALAVYHVLFFLSYFQTGKPTIQISWGEIGKYIVSEQGNVIEDTSTIKRRMPELIDKKCIVVNRKRTGANEITVKLPSEIPLCIALMKHDKEIPEAASYENIDYFSSAERRLEVFERDNHKCTYCRIELDENTFVLDHIIPMAKGGSNKRDNLVTSCEPCNTRKSENDVFEFLNSNYRNHLISQKEFLYSKELIETLLEKQTQL